MRIYLFQLLAAAFSTLVSCSSSAEQVGRLFFTPEQRAVLDMQRNTGESPSLSEGAGAAQQGGEITLNGIVKRSNGKSTVWVNQVVQRESDPAPGLKALPRHARLPSVPVFVPGLGKTVHLKVGQTLDSDSGEIRENYQPASGNVPPSPAPQAALPPA